MKGFFNKKFALLIVFAGLILMGTNFLPTETTNVKAVLEKDLQAIEGPTSFLAAEPSCKVFTNNGCYCKGTSCTKSNGGGYIACDDGDASTDPMTCGDSLKAGDNSCSCEQMAIPPAN